MFNLSYLFKLLDKVVHARMLAHIEAIGAMSRTQSAYLTVTTAKRRCFWKYSTIWQSPSIRGSLLIFFARPFSGVQHDGPWNSPRQTRKTYGFSWSTLEWLGTYLANRLFQVNLFCNLEIIVGSIEMWRTTGFSPWITLVYYLYGATRWRCCSTWLQAAHNQMRATIKCTFIVDTETSGWQFQTSSRALPRLMIG